MQSNSPQATDPEIEVSPAEYIINATNKVVAKADEEVEAIPLFCVKKWRCESRPVNTSEMFEWVKTELYTSANSDAPYNWEEDGLEYRNVMVHEWIFLLTADIEQDLKARAMIAKGEMPDLDDALLPTIFSLKRSSMPASKELFKFQAKAESFGLPISVTTVKFGRKFVKEDKFSYYVTTMTKGRKSTPDEIEVCKNWHGILYAGGFKVDESGLDEETPKNIRAANIDNNVSSAKPRNHQASDAGHLTDEDIPF